VPTALPKLLLELSDHRIPFARSAVFVTESSLAVSTKEGTLIEVKLEAQPNVVKARPTPRQATKVRDSDY
jgi:hypothetical protein